jgi:hypothetical protein
MSLVNRMLFKLSSYLRCRVIRGARGEPYLERYHLLHLPFGIHLYLHRFIASDPGRALHNHPWRSALAWVLSGEYRETRLADKDGELETRSVSAGRCNYISGKIYHRIDVAPGQQVWTLFIHTRSHRSWGFLDTRERRFSYTDHNLALGGESNPNWWRSALRPWQQPQMRSGYEL